MYDIWKNMRTLQDVMQEILSCQKCPLYKERINPVPGEGPSDAKIMMIGEAPGKEEDRSGRPFVGRAGKLLDRYLEMAGLKREDIFITSVLKCRPPLNRTPRKIEIQACMPYLMEQIEIISPKVIIALGNTALKVLCGASGIKKLHGKVLECITYRIIPTYHPAAILRNPNLGDEFLRDLMMIKTFI